MTAAGAVALRTVAFGELEGDVWGVVIAGSRVVLALGNPGARAVSECSLDGSSETVDWRIGGPEIELVLEGAGPHVPAPEAGGFDQMCRVRGRFVLHGREHEVDCLGRRGTRDETYVEQFHSLRDVCAWFAPDEGVAVTALRPRKAAGHSADVLTAALFDPDGPAEVQEPLLSTTYAADGMPSRVGLELWLEGEGSEQYPRRFAGEAMGTPLAVSCDGFEIHAVLLRCHSRGRDGAGMYLLARRA